MSVYVHFNNDDTDSYSYHWAFWLGWLGNIMLLVATGLAIHDSRRPFSPYDNAQRLK